MNNNSSTCLNIFHTIFHWLFYEVLKAFHKIAAGKSDLKTIVCFTVLNVLNVFFCRLKFCFNWRLRSWRSNQKICLWREFIVCLQIIGRSMNKLWWIVVRRAWWTFRDFAVFSIKISFFNQIYAASRWLQFDINCRSNVFIVLENFELNLTICKLFRPWHLAWSAN